MNPLYTLEFTDKKFFLHVNAFGLLNSETDEEIDAEIKKECDARSIDSVLIDIRQMTSRLSGVENHVAAKTIKDRLQGVTSIAIVDLKKYDNKSEMYQLTAKNRDTNIRFFHSVSKAVEWLLGNSNVSRVDKVT